jgi:hypothetical protein
MNDRSRRINIVGAAIVLALGAAISAITSAVVAARAYERRPVEAARAVQSMTVKGSARRAVRADQAVWRIEIAGEGADIPAAFGELERAAAATTAFLAERGFSPAEMALSAIETQTHYARNEHGQATREVAGFTLERSLMIASGNVDRVAAGAGEVTELLRDGLRIRSQAPEFTITDVGALKIALIGEASADARTRADAIASKAGCRVAEVRGASQGVIHITQPHSTEVASGGIYDTATIAKDVSVVVTVTFGIEED